MKSFLKIFTKERVVFGIIISLIGLSGTIYTARSQAASKTQEDLDAFKVSTIKDIIELNKTVSKLDGTVTQMNSRVEDVKGITQDMQSRLNQFIDNYRK